MSAAALRMYWWRLHNRPSRNFGDEISPLLVREIFGRECRLATPDACEIVAAGSVAEIVRDTKWANRPVLWGTGFLRDEDDQIGARDFEVAAVRGARSRDRLEDGREKVALGDPGLLADALLTTTPGKTHALGVLPHFLDADVAEVGWLRHQDGVRLIDATADPRTVVEQIASCETLLSSSLHGLVVADAVGVPNGHLRLSANPFIGGMHKFRDYYSVFADPARHFVLSPGRVLGAGIAETVALVQERYRRPHDLAGIKAALIAAFPLA